ncbi:uncharacterized protein LOC117647067 [Thrips palmi]|uniref:Uncharacterized protein LOC117647067 n=1 Tax=Thrips palmi TaxID=161013 RepID=A0A6P8ZPP3_THRPL|nr:uncharacterized protein LOC117647067 [Thrips palmi]
MAEEMPTVRVESSWDGGVQKSLQDAVALTHLSSHKRNEDGSLTDMVQPDTCILLTRPCEENGNQETTSQSCSISLRLDPSSPFAIASLVIVCEARMVEIYGAHNEYLMTASAELIDEVGDMAVYCAQVDLTQLTQECTLKFARLKKPSEMWLYGIKVIWSRYNSSSLTSQTVGVNFDSVEQRLRQSQTQLSGRAERCKQFLKMYSSLNEEKKSLQGFPDPMSLLSLIPAMTRQCGSQKNYFALRVESPSDVPSTSALSSDKEAKDSSGSICSGCSDKIESMLEKKLSSMENRIMGALDVKLAAMQEHQDRQIQSLFNLLERTVSGGVKFKPKIYSETADQHFPDRESAMEHSIKKILDEKVNLLNKEAVFRRNTCEGNTDNILRNAFMALKLNEMYTGASHSDMDSTSATTVVQKGS